MSESYSVFKRYSLYSVTVLSLLIPALIVLIAGLASHTMYGYSVPIYWYFITLLPLILLGYTVTITRIDNLIVVKHKLFDFELKNSTYTTKTGDEIGWLKSSPTDKVYKFMVGNIDTGLRVNK